VGADVREYSIPFGSLLLPADLLLPVEAPRALVVVAHGQSSGRESPRGRRLSQWLVATGTAVLLPDLRVEQDDVPGHGDVEARLSALRLKGVVRWARQRPDLAALPLGLAGAGTGAAAALRVAAELGGDVGAVGCRSPRLEHAGRWLRRVEAPVLLVVGDEDRRTLDLSRRAVGRLRCERALLVLPGATRLLDEPGALDSWCRAAAAWFERHLVVASGSAGVAPGS